LCWAICVGSSRLDAPAQVSYNEFKMCDDEYRHILSRLDILEHDVGDIKEELKGLRREMNARFDQVNARFDQMYDRMLVQTRWLIGSLALIGTVVSLLLAIGQFVR